MSVFSFNSSLSFSTVCNCLVWISYIIWTQTGLIIKNKILIFPGSRRTHDAGSINRMRLMVTSTSAVSSKLSYRWPQISLIPELQSCFKMARPSKLVPTKSKNAENQILFKEISSRWTSSILLRYCDSWRGGCYSEISTPWCGIV